MKSCNMMSWRYRVKTNLNNFFLFSDPKGYFEVGPTVPDSGITYAANLSLRKSIDREQLGGRYSFNISVSCVCFLKKQFICLLTVIVKGVPKYI